MAAAATPGSIPQQRILHAAAELGFRIVQYETIVAAASGEAGKHQATFTEAFADCMYHIGSAAVAAAAVLAADGAWKQEAAGDALAAVTWLCSWLLSATAAGELISLLQQHVQQRVVQLLSDGGPVASALPAAAAGYRANAAKHIADWVEVALQHGGISRVPPLSLAARALRMLCDSEPLSASCLGTSFGEERLHIEVSVPPPRRAQRIAAEHVYDWAGRIIIKSQPCTAVSLSCMHAARSQQASIGVCDSSTVSACCRCRCRRHCCACCMEARLQGPACCKRCCALRCILSPDGRSAMSQQPPHSVPAPSVLRVPCL